MSKPEFDPIEQEPYRSFLERNTHLPEAVQNRFRAWFRADSTETLKPPGPYDHILEGRKRTNPVEFARNFRNATKFKEFDADLVIVEDTVGFTRIVDGEEEDYLTKQAKDRKDSGKNEAASWGVGSIGNKRFVGFIFNWEFMLATSGKIVGEKLIRAMKYAQANNLPVVILYCSGGQRQQEAVPGLREMDRSVYAVEELYKEKTNLPIISTIIGSTFGGVTASILTKGDLVTAEAGSDLGFAGRRVIEASEGQEPPDGAQTVENSFLTNRSVQMIFNDLDELLEFLGANFSIVNGKDQNGKVRRLRETTCIDLDGHTPSFKTPFRRKSIIRHQRSKIHIPYEEENIPEGIFGEQTILRSDPRRPDTLYTLRHGFDNFVPYFTGRLVIDKYGRHLIYPGIVAALAYIDDPRLPERLKMMIIGDQPGYIRLDSGAIVKDHAAPTAWDYRYQLKMLKYANRLRYPVVSFVDTFGAKASIKDELDAQYDTISECLTAKRKHPYLTMGYILGMSGSGGGLATLFNADYLAQLSDAQEFVAEPKSATAILYRDPKDEDVIRTAEEMKPTADFSLSVGLIDKVIQVPKGGAQNNPLATVLAVREDIILTFLELGGLTTEDLKARRGLRIENPQAFPVGYLESTTKRPRHGFPFHLPGH